jgi:hypothetical protein
MSLRRLLPLALSPLLVLALACSDDEGSGDGGSDTSAATGDTAGGDVDLSGLPTYDTITALNEDLAAGGVQCTLEYEGLVDSDGKEVSLCTINGEQAQISVYPDSTTVQALVAADATLGALVYGQNWTVQLDTEATAQTVATALSGEVVAAAAAGSTTTAAPTTVAP